MTEPTSPAPDFTSPIAGRIEVRVPCSWCVDGRMIPSHQFDEHVMRLHPGVSTSVRRAATTPADSREPDNPAAYALAKHIGDHPISTVQAAFRYLNTELTLEARDQSAVLPAPADRAAHFREAADELASIRLQFADACECGDCGPCAWVEAEKHLRRLADEAQQGVPMSPAYARLQVAAKEAAEAAHLHAMHGMRGVYQLCRRYGFGDTPIPAAEVLAALGLDENANTVEAEGAQR